MQSFVLVEQVLQHILDKTLLHHTEGNHTDTLRTEFLVTQATFYLLNYSLCFGFVLALASLVIKSRHRHMVHLGARVVDRREGDKRAIVIFAVGESYETFMT